MARKKDPNKATNTVDVVEAEVREMTPYQKIKNGETISGTERETAMFKFACALNKKSLPKEKAKEECLQVNEKQFSPPLSKELVIKKLDAAFSYTSGIEEAFPEELAITTRTLELPDTIESKNGNTRYLASSGNVRAMLDYIGVTVYFDVILRSLAIRPTSGIVPDVLAQNAGSLDVLSAFIADVAVKIPIQGLTSNKAAELLELIARGNRRNIPLERLQAAYNEHCPINEHGIVTGIGECWGELDKMIDCITFTDDETTPHNGRSMILKWMAQVCAMISNDKGSYGAEACLTLQGAQGVGKTRFGSVLCSFFGSEYFREGIMFSRTKDDFITFTTCVIGEIGEAARSIKDVDYTKNFLTTKKDEYRAPYGRGVESYPRRSSYYATANDETFLRDTENRRFWVLFVENIDCERILNEVDLSKVWALAYWNWETQGQKAFRLAPEERKAAEAMAQKVRRVSAEEQAILDRLNWDATPELWEFKNSTEIAEIVGLNTDRNVYIGRAMSALGYDKAEELKQKKILDGIALYFVPPVITVNDSMDIQGRRRE